MGNLKAPLNEVNAMVESMKYELCWKMAILSKFKNVIHPKLKSY